MYNSKVLITGINGFTGLHLANLLVRLGAKVYGIGIGANKSLNISDKIIIQQCDILDSNELKRMLSVIQPNFIFHLAGDSSNIGNGLRKYNVNIIGTENLLNAIIDSKLISFKKLIVSSTAAVYGNSISECNESSFLEPITHYGISKLGMEKVCKTFFDKIPIIITRPFNYTGIGQDKHFLIPKIVANFKEKRAFIELGNIAVFREFNSLEYVLDCYVKLMTCTSKGDIVNICTNKTYSINEIITLCENLTNHSISVKVNKAFVRANEIRELKGSTNHLERLIEPDYTKNDLTMTLKDMLNDKK